jgi:hypothetical protein
LPARAATVCGATRAMSRPKKSVQRSRTNGAKAKNKGKVSKKTKAKVPVLAWHFNNDRPDDYGVTIWKEKRAKLPRGVCYEDQLEAYKMCLREERRVCFDISEDKSADGKEAWCKRREAALKQEEELDRKAWAAVMDARRADVNAQVTRLKKCAKGAKNIRFNV